MSRWGGWIPTLSGDIFITNITSSLQAKHYIQDKKKGYWWKYVDLSDEYPPEKVILEIDFIKKLNDKLTFPVRIRRFSNIENKKTVYYQGNCSVYQNGLFFIDGKAGTSLLDFDKDLAFLVYTHVRDLYHQHTHHSETNRELLHLTRTNTRKGTVDDLIRQYKTKIQEYHHISGQYIRFSGIGIYITDIINGALRSVGLKGRKRKKIESSTTFPSAYFLQAQGEMLYAKIALVLFKNYFCKDERKALYQKFNYAYDSFAILREEIVHTYQDYANKVLLALTFILVAFAITTVFPSMTRRILTFVLMAIYGIFIFSFYRRRRSMQTPASQPHPSSDPGKDESIT